MKQTHIELSKAPSMNRLDRHFLMERERFQGFQNELSGKLLYLWYVPSKTLNHQMFHQILKNTDERVVILELAEEMIRERLMLIAGGELMPDAVLCESCGTETMEILKESFIKVVNVESAASLNSCSSAKAKVVISGDYASSVRALESCLKHARLGSFLEAFESCFGIEFHAEKTVITPVPCLNVVWSKRVIRIFENLPGQRVFVDLNEVDLLDASGLLALIRLEQHIHSEGGIVALKNISLKARNFLDVARECFPELNLERFRLIS